MLSHTHYIFCMLFRGNNTCPEHLFSLDITDFLINLHDLTTVNYLTTQNTTELVCVCVCVCIPNTHQQQLFGFGTILIAPSLTPKVT